MDTDASAVPVPSVASTRRASALLETLYVEHHNVVFRYLRAISHDEDQALDLAATTFERAFAELRAGRQPGLGWLLRTARNAAIDADRRRRVAALFRQRSAAPDSASSPEDHALGAERAQRIHSALALLPQPQRDAIALRYTSELTVKEIAEVISKSPSATQKLLDRGLVRLKESLDDLA